MKRFFTVAALVIAFAGSALADEVTNAWAKFKVGSWSKTKTVTTTTMPNMKMENTTTITYKLVEITADEVVIEMESESTSSMNGTETKTPPQKTTTRQPLKTKVEPAAKTEGPKAETGEEDLDIAGKKIHCSWSKSVMEANGMKTTSQTWWSNDVPGGAVKMVSETAGAAASKLTTELVGFEAK